MQREEGREEENNFVTNIEERKVQREGERDNNKYKETTTAHFSLGLTTNCLGTDSTQRVWRQ